MTPSIERVHALARKQDELRCIRYELAARKFINALEAQALLRAKYNASHKYNDDQPRVPPGNPTGGQWTSGGGGGVEVAASEFSGGTLAAEYMTGGGRRCIYTFDFGLVVVPGPVNFRCPTWTTSAGVSHGRLLNDNRKMVLR